MKFLGQPFNAGEGPCYTTTSDFNGDGLTDMATANGSSVSVLIGIGDATFSAQQNNDAGSSNCTLATGDFNGDGVIDLATTNLPVCTVTVVLGKGDGTFGFDGDFVAGFFPFCDHR